MSTSEGSALSPSVVAMRVEAVPISDYREKYAREIEQARGVSLPEGVNLVGAFIRATKPV